jgi:hypothetical protein
MSTRRLILAALVSLCTVFGTFALVGASAQAFVTHEYLSQESPEDYVPFSPSGASAVDESTSPSDWAQGDTYEIIGELGFGGGFVGKAIGVFRTNGSGEREQVAELFKEQFVREIAVDDANGDVIARGATAVESAGDIYTGPEITSVFEPTLPGDYALVRDLTTREPGGKVNSFAVDQGTGEIYAVEGEGSAVEELSSSGTYLGRFPGASTPSGHFGERNSLSIDPTTHNVYVYDESESVVDIFGPDVTAPDVTTGASSRLKGTSAILTGTVDPDAAGVATCQFEWGPANQFGHVAPCSAPVAEGESSVPVQAQLTGLEPDMEYCYLLQASNANGTNPGESFQDRCFTTPGPADVEESSVFAVTSDSATLGAMLNPDLAPATYYFQYGTTGSYGTNVPVAPGTSVGSTEGSVDVTQHVQKLEAGIVYHYRVVEVREPEQGTVETFYGPDQTFMTQGAGSESGLPDGRQWELVTPADKHGALFYSNDAVVEGAPIQASVDGEAIVDIASSPTEVEPQGYSDHVAVLSTRGAAGWSSQTLAPPHEQATGPLDRNEYHFFSEDLSQGVMEPLGTFTRLSPEATESTPYLRTDFLNGDVSEHCEESCYHPLVTAKNTLEHTEFGISIHGEPCGPGTDPEAPLCGPLFVDATPDLSHIIMYTDVRLTSSAPEGGGLYEWSGGQLQYVSVLPEGSDSAAKLAGTTGLESSENMGARHAISQNGERVILRTITAGAGPLYLRDIAKEETIELGTEVIYQDASSDDSRVFFLEDGDLDECEIGEVAGKLHCQLSDLTPSDGGEPAKVREVLGTSEDGSYVYFAAAGVLANGAAHTLCQEGISGVGENETCNIYVWHDGVTALVAPAGPPAMYSRVSPDGEWFEFMSNQDLTGYDTRDAVSGHLDVEVYLYDAATRRLVCASCNPTGARPVGVEAGNGSAEKIVVDDDLEGRGSPWFAATVPTWTAGESHQFNQYLHQPRYLSDSGRLFFDSNDALVPQDVNGTLDVYEYEPSGVGDCTTANLTYSERSDGCVGLISSGTSPEESAFVDASETGGDVFFLTAAKLVPEDYDDAPDVYDAHECSSVAPCYPVAPVAPPACSTGDSCKPAPTPQPAIFGPAASATFSGAGNFSPSSQAPVPVVKARALTRAQKLARALRTCRRKYSKSTRRSACEREGRKRYGVRSSASGVKRERRG